MRQGNQEKTYLDLLEASLIKKSATLAQLIQLTEEQETLINHETIDDNEFNQIISKKEELIQIIIQLDEGFEQVYQRVNDELLTNSNLHKANILRLQELIKKITDQGIQLQVIEMRNKIKMETYFQIKRSKIKNFKLSNKSVTSYYSNMTGQSQQDSYFFDKKK